MMKLAKAFFGVALVLAALALSALTGCSDPDPIDYRADCPAEPDAAACVAFCQDTDPTASWCGSLTGADAGLPDGGGEADGAGSDDCGGCDGGTVCDTASDVCVTCLADADCADGVCLVGATSADNSCVECAETADCDSGVCDGGTNTCVACLDDGDCDDPGAARCETGATAAGNVCAGCDDSGQCAGIGETGICDADNGRCVECFAASEESDCNGTFCNGATNECTSTPFGTTNGCDTCSANSDCTAGYRCIPMQFQGADRGNYCMPVFAGPGSCPPTYGTSEIDRMTVDGTLETMCLITEGNVTCEAIEEYREPCPNGNECTADGSRCEMIGAEMQCTYTCESSNDCSAECGGNQPKYCGG